MKLDEKYSLVADSLNWVLKFEEFNEVEDEKTKELKTVKSSWESYHGELKFALHKYCDSVTKPCESVAELMERLNEVENKINNLKLIK